MKLRSINRILRKVGLLLVVQTGDAGEPTLLRIQRASVYKNITASNRIVT